MLIEHLTRHILNRQKRKNFVLDYKAFVESLKASDRNEFDIKWSDRYPILNEKTATTTFDAHYVYHTAWAARIIAETKPVVHVDISSLLYFATLVSAFVPVEFYDLRPAKLNLKNLTCKSANLYDLKFPDNSISSLSCMHVVEHIGLGRYGDPLDPDGDIKAIRELKRVLAKNGQLLFVVPVGQPKICFNAHRIYSYNQVISYFSDLKLCQFAMVDDKGEFVINPSPSYSNQQKYACGCWWFIRE